MRELREKISRIIAMEDRGSVRVMNVLEFLERFVVDGIGDEDPGPLRRKSGLLLRMLSGAAAQSRLLRPPRGSPQHGRDPEEDRGHARRMGLQGRMLRRGILGVPHRSGGQARRARSSKTPCRRGAQAIVVACPMCHSNLDMRRSRSNKGAGRNIRSRSSTSPRPSAWLWDWAERAGAAHRHVVPGEAFPGRGSGRQEGTARNRADG